MRKEIAAILGNEISAVKQNKGLFLEIWYRNMYPYIPYRTGLLADNISIESDGVHFKQIYANRQYTGDNFNFNKEIHPLACARWGEVAAAMHSERMIKEFKRRMIIK